MSFQVAAHQAEGYRVNTALFEGPLDLLLELIERAELDITTLALAQVTDQYLEYMRQLEERDAAEVSAFLVIAARLLQIKSAALLPRPSLRQLALQEEDPAEALARQLLLYKRFKDLAEQLSSFEAQGHRTYLRLAPAQVKVEPRFDLNGVTLHDLMMAARNSLFTRANLPALNRVVSIPRITIREKIRSIIYTLRTFGSTSFRKLISTRRDRLEIVVTFLAMLELIKRRVVDAQQSALFEDIELQTVGDINEVNDSEEEFME